MLRGRRGLRVSKAGGDKMVEKVYITRDED